MKNAALDTLNRKKISNSQVVAFVIRTSAKKRSLYFIEESSSLKEICCLWSHEKSKPRDSDEMKQHQIAGRNAPVVEVHVHTTLFLLFPIYRKP